MCLARCALHCGVPSRLMTRLHDNVSEEHTDLDLRSQTRLISPTRALD